MRKFYSFLAFALMMVVSQVANAWSFDLPEENEVLQSEAYNMRLYKNYDFFGGKYNGQPMTDANGNPVSGDGCLVWSPDASTLKLNASNTYQVQSPVEMTNFIGQFGSSNMLNLRAGVGKTGMHNYGSGPRWFAIADMKAGQIIVLQHSEDTNDGKGNPTTIKPNVIQNNANSSWADVPTDPIQVADITAEIHEIQDLVDADGDGEADGIHDGFHYWKVLVDGYVYVEMERNTSIQGIQIWIDAAAEEAVTSPILKLAAVNGNSRSIEFTPGESTFGTACKTYWGIIEQGEQALFLKDSEEIDHYDYTYKVDEEGNFILDEEGNKIVDTETPVYKQVLDMDAVNEYGMYGDRLYEGLPVEITNNDDEDGDGYVTVAAATVSENGAYSSVVTLNISVGEITLNAPTLTLVGVNGVDRSYKIGWNNNTICDETFVIKVEGSGADDGFFTEYEENQGIGDVISIKEHATVTVSVQGYADGVAEVDAQFAGIDVKRKSDKEGHDWDFVNISQEVSDMFNALVPGAYYEFVGEGEVKDTIVHTVAEYEAQEAAGADVSDWEMVPEKFGWWQPIASNRTTLNVIEGGKDQNANGFGYEDEKTGIFHDLTISCPPNANNASCIFKYIGKTDGNELGALGVYFMAKPTITFPREIAKAGELVEIYYGTGGSNYTTTTTHAMYEVPQDELLSVTLPGSGVHVFYIDVYTYDELPDDPNYEKLVSVEGVVAAPKVSAIFTVSGAKVANLQKGINIVKMSDNSVRKIFVK